MASVAEYSSSLSASVDTSKTVDLQLFHLRNLSRVRAERWMGASNFGLPASACARFWSRNDVAAHCDYWISSNFSLLLNLGNLSEFIS